MLSAPCCQAAAGSRVIMEPRGINAFADTSLDDSLKLAIARDLQRQLSAVLNEPLPPDLQRIVVLLENLPSSPQRKNG